MAAKYNAWFKTGADSYAFQAVCQFVADWRELLNISRDPIDLFNLSSSDQAGYFFYAIN